MLSEKSANKINYLSKMGNFKKISQMLGIKYKCPAGHTNWKF